MKTWIRCFTLLTVSALLILLDARYPQLLSPQTFFLLLLALAITLLVQIHPAKDTHLSR